MHFAPQTVKTSYGPGWAFTMNFLGGTFPVHRSEITALDWSLSFGIFARIVRILDNFYSSSNFMNASEAKS